MNKVTFKTFSNDSVKNNVGDNKFMTYFWRVLQKIVSFHPEVKAVALFTFHVGLDNSIQCTAKGFGLMVLVLVATQG